MPSRRAAARSTAVAKAMCCHWAKASAPSAVVQTTDGYIWIGTSAGLLRFDGVRFVPWTPGEGNQWFSSNSVWSLLAGRDGSLWIGTSTNLARLKALAITHEQRRLSFNGLQCLARHDQLGGFVAERNFRCDKGAGFPPMVWIG